MIYMIGVGWEEPNLGEWIFRCFVADRLDLDHEAKILNEWISYMNEVKKTYKIRKQPRIYHWSHAEVTFSSKAFMRHGISVKLNWYDLLDFFKKNNIVIKGVFNYGLKNVANGLYKHKMIKTRWEDNSTDGVSAMLAAWYCEKMCQSTGGTLPESKNIQEIIKYNEVDCKVLWDILKIFR